MSTISKEPMKMRQDELMVIAGWKYPRRKYNEISSPRKIIKFQDQFSSH